MKRDSCRPSYQLTALLIPSPIHCRDLSYLLPYSTVLFFQSIIRMRLWVMALVASSVTFAMRVDPERIAARYTVDGRVR